MSHDGFYLVLVTCESIAQAEKISNVLIEKRLAGCVSMVDNVSSIYRWEGKIEKSKEVLLLIKTHKSHFKELEIVVKENHSYANPEIVGISFDNASSEYLEWLKKEVERRSP